MTPEPSQVVPASRQSERGDATGASAHPDPCALPPAERERIIVDFNRTHRTYPLHKPLHQLVEEQVERSPEALALQFEGAGLSYRELNGRANQLAHHLKRSGVRHDDLVAVCAERSLEMVIALLAILKAGAAYVPLDPDYPAARLQDMLVDANARVLLTQEHLLDRIPPGAKHVLCLDRDASLFANEAQENLPWNGLSERIAYAIYTSGSTGKPKGVPNTHAGIVNRLLWMQDEYKLDSDDRVLQKTPYSFDVSVWEFFWPLLAGAQLVVARPGGQRDPAYLIELIVREQITTLHFVPSMLSVFLDAPGVERCTSLRRVFASGEALPLELQKRFFGKLSAELHNLYGPTEAAVDVTYWHCRPDSGVNFVPIGKPVANTQIYILGNTLQPAPIGVTGELHIGGVQVAPGYLNRPELTAEKFIRDPFGADPQARLYKTGDLARFLSDGNIEYLGRMDHQVKLRGFRIELGEIESVLSGSPDVRQAVVVLREHASGEKALLAYVVPAFGHTIDEQALRANALKLLPEFMLPSAIVVVDELPITSSGKVDRKQLMARADEVAPSLSEYTSPQDELEVKLAEIFASLLHAKKISVTANFFDLGGQSLLAARLMSEIARVTGRHLPVSILLYAASVEEIAKVLRDESAAHGSRIAHPVQEGESATTVFAVACPGVETLGYALLARHLRPEQSLVCLQAATPAVDDGVPYTANELQSMAAQYIAAMRAVQTTGPYCVMGECEGVHIAQEMVLQLEAQGQEVALFANLDTWVLQNTQVHWKWRVNYYRRRLRQLGTTGLPEQVAAWKQAVKTNTGAISESGAPALRTDWAQVYWPGKNFKAPQFRAPVLLFKRPRQPFFYINDPEMGWGKRSLGGVEIHPIDFDHDAMLREPFVKEIATVLTRRLDGISTRSLASEARAALGKSR